MKNPERYRHLRVDWVGQSSTQSITLCGVEGEDIGTVQTLCPNCAQVGEALNVCGLGPESLRELFDTLRVFGSSEVKAEDGGASRSGGADGYAGSVATQLTEWTPLVLIDLCGKPRSSPPAGVACPLSLSPNDPGSVLTVKGPLRALDRCGPIWRDALFTRGKGAFWSCGGAGREPFGHTRRLEP